MSSRKQDKDRKLVTVGDGGCGKTCLLTVYSEGRFPEVNQGFTHPVDFASYNLSV
jgi:GTPase SAR1 family protein